jgi:xylulokinase
MSEDSSLILGIDLGTSAVKVVALAADGALVGESEASFSTLSALPLQAEQAPSDWIDALVAAMAAMHSSVEGTLQPDWRQRIAAIGLTGQLPTLVCLGETTPIAPAIIWNDGRADEWVASRVDARQRAAMYSRTGMPIDGRYLAPMLRYHFSDRMHEMRTLLSAKDYLLWTLTGQRCTEPSTAAGYGLYDLRTGAFSEELANFWQVPTVLLPPLKPSNSLAGPLSAAGAALLGLQSGVPVSTGAADSVCTAYTLAGLDERIVAIGCGSSTVIVGASAALRLDPQARYLLTPHVVAGWYGREMDLLATGTGHRWLSMLLGWREEELDVRAADSVPGARGLLFPPYLAGGEQGALWDPHLSGAILGLTLRHTAADVARAFLEGVFFEIRRCIEVLAENTPVDSVRVSGALVRFPTSLQMLADILGRSVEVAIERSAAAVGAAWLARPLTGEQPCERRRKSEGRAIRPAPTSARIYQQIYPRYLERAQACG